jgi:hypothetical protein
MRDAGDLRYIPLAQPASKSNRSQYGAESLVFHAATVVRMASPAIIADFTALRITTPCHC